MYRMLFTNRWIALAFVAVVVVSALAFVGTQDQEGAYGMAKHSLHEQQEAVEKQIEVIQQPEPSPEEPAEFMSDEELIDDATGDEVSSDEPTDDDSNAAAPDDGEIIVQDSSDAEN